MQAAIPLILFLILICGFAAAALRSHRRARRRDSNYLDILLACLEPVNIAGVSTVACDYLESRRREVAIVPEVIWDQLGGEAGLRAMCANAEFLLAIAHHAMQWNEFGGALAAMSIREDALRLRKAVRQVRLGMFLQRVTGQHWLPIPIRLQQAATAYYLMRRRLLNLYQTTHVGLLPRLARAV